MIIILNIRCRDFQISETNGENAVYFTTLFVVLCFLTFDKSALPLTKNSNQVYFRLHDLFLQQIYLV